MPNHVLLNNVDHHDLRVITTRSADYGDDVVAVPTFSGEFRDLQACYPIAFQKTREGEFQPLALLGLRQGENLFLLDGHWDAPYVPLAIERQPFLIGIADEEPMVHIDLGHPRATRDAAAGGEPLFLEHGGTAPYLERMASVLRALHEGLRDNAVFVEVLLRHQLLEPFVLDVRLDDQSQSRLTGLHTINEERLRALEGPILQELSRSGYLQAAYMAIASLSHLRDLIERANRRAAHR
jgi:SapC protein